MCHPLTVFHVACDESFKATIVPIRKVLPLQHFKDPFDLFFVHVCIMASVPQSSKIGGGVLQHTAPFIQYILLIYTFNIQANTSAIRLFAVTLHLCAT